MEQCSRCFQHQEGAELGLNGMDNLGELLINAVTARKPKMLLGLNQNGKWSGLEVTSSSNVDIRTTGEKASPNPFGYLCGTWKPRNLPV